MADFANYLREKRQAAGLNQSELAAQLGLTGSYISILENRKKPPPSDAVLRRLAKAIKRPVTEVLEIAHLDRAPDDIRQKIRALDRRLKMERKLTQRLLQDLLPSSLWHFWRVRGYHEYGIEKIRLDEGKKRILRKILRRIGHLTTRRDFEEESRLVIEALPLEERAVLAQVLPELVPDEGDPPLPDGPLPEDPAVLRVPVLRKPPRGAARKGKHLLPVDASSFPPGGYFLVAPDGEMQPRIEEGDLLLVAPGAEPAPGRLLVVDLGGKITVREVATVGRNLVLTAPGPRVPPATAAPGSVYGVVVEIRRQLP